MTNIHSSFWRLFLIFGLLGSHIIVMCDIRNESIFEPTVHDSPNIDSFSENNSSTIEETYENNNAMFGKKTNTLFANSFFPVARISLENKTKFEAFVMVLHPRKHYKRVRRYRHRRINSMGTDQSTANPKLFPQSANGFTAMKSNYFRAMLKNMENIYGTANKIHSPKEIGNVSLFAGIFSADIIKYYRNKDEANMLKMFHHVTDRSRNPFTRRYAYFTDNPELRTPENVNDDFVDCYKSHETCRTLDRLNQSRRRMMCSCEEDCEDYGNCCADHRFHDLTMNKVRYSCSKTGTYTGYFALSSCPSFWKNTHVHSLCDSSKNDESDVFLQVPVSNRDTYLTYSNIYCAFCNGDTNVEFWTVEARCPNHSSLDSAASTNLKGCSHRFLAPLHLLRNNEEPTNTRFKKCRHDVVDKCSRHWMLQAENQTGTEVAAKCALLYAPVSLFGIWTSEATIYKNEFCAICNGVTAMHLFCPVVKMPRSSMPQGSPLPILLDMDFTRGGMIVGSQKRCPYMHLYDPWKKECRSIACRPQFDYKDGHCVPQKTYSDNLMKYQYGKQLSNETSFSDCLQMIFSLEEVSILENGTLVVVSEGSFYQPKEYEITDNSTVTVCIRSGTYSLYVSTFTSFQGYFTIAGMSISLVSLLVRIILSIFFPERHKPPPKIVLFLSITLFFSQMLFIFGVYQTETHVVCVVIGIFMHYGFLSSFFWTNVLAYDIWKTFGSSRVMTKARCGEKRLIYYCMHAWISPLFIVTLAAAFDWIGNYELLKPQYGKSVCWLSNKAALAAFFGLPLAILLVSNTIFFFITSMEIRKTTKATKFAHTSCSGGAKNRTRFGLYCKLAFIMGLTWVFGFIAAFSGSSILWYFFIAFNSIQGVYIFVAFTYFKIPSYIIPKKSSQWTLSGNSTTSRSSNIAKV